MKVKASELRIGNLVNFSVGSSYYQGTVQTIGSKIATILCLGKTYAVKYVNITPIVLTEELLVKLGFEKNETGFYYKGRFTYHNEYGWKILEQWVKNWVGVSELKYVHQLQNLYFALTGEELTIN